MKYTLPLLLWAALFTACTQDEADIPQNHSLLELTASMAEPNTRATPDGTWTGGEKSPKPIIGQQGKRPRMYMPYILGMELRKILYGMEAEVGAFKATRPETAIRKATCCGL